MFDMHQIMKEIKYMQIIKNYDKISIHEPTSSLRIGSSPLLLNPLWQATLQITTILFSCFVLLKTVKKIIPMLFYPAISPGTLSQRK